jgi:O-antigen ligase/tetratricopeptide (TPR) repeat protein
VFDKVVNMNLEKSLRFIVIAGVFTLPFIPLIVAQSLFFPFITGKNFTFRIIVEIITAAWLALAFVNPVYRPNRSWLLGAFATFVLVIGIADIFGVNAFKSFWSNFERMEGWVTLAHLLAYFTVTISMFKTEQLWKRLFQTSIGVSILVGVYGLLQLAGYVTINQGGVRLDATFGNATYLAIYMLFHIFLTLFLLVNYWRDNEKKIAPSLIYGGIILLQAVILFFTATRGAILGLVGGIVLTALLMIVFGNRSKHAWRIATGTVVVSLVLIGGFLLLKDTSVVRSSETLSRLADISLTEATVTARFMNWGMALQGVKERPILGWGQENYNIVFNKYFNPGMYAQEPWFDRVHNVVFDWLIAGGIIGFLAYISLFFFALLYLWRGSAFTVSEKSVFTGLLAAYGFHNLFVFDNIVSYILFVTVLAYISTRTSNEKNSPLIVNSEFLPRRALPIISIVAIVMVWGVAWGVNAKALAANRALLQAVAPQQEGVTKNIEKFQESIDYGTYGTQEAREHLMQGASRLVGDSNVPADVKQELFEIAAREMKAQEEAAPNDARFPLVLGVLLSTYGQHDEALLEFERARELSPTKQTILFQLGNNALNRSDLPAALERFKEAYELAPEYRDAHIFYIIAAIRSEKFDLAQELIDGLAGSDAFIDQRILGAFVEKGRNDLAVLIWERYLDENPQNMQAYFSLAAAYYSVGQSSKAINSLEKAIEVNPAIGEQARALIEQIRNGSAQLQ